jgi:hypothetical protein
MASIDDVFHQLQTVNNNLTLLHTDNVAETNAVNQVNTSIGTLTAAVNTGFAQTVNALTVLAQIEEAMARLLFHLTQQTDTMICALEHVSRNTCGILTQTTIQTRLQTQMAGDLQDLEDVTEIAYPAATVEHAKLAKLKAEIERCCPPEVPPPACTYEPCPAPRPIPMPDLPKIPDQPRPPG